MAQWKSKWLTFSIRIEFVTFRVSKHIYQPMECLDTCFDLTAILPVRKTIFSQISKPSLRVTRKYWKAILNFSVSVHLSVCPSPFNNFLTCGQTFVKINIWKFIENWSRKFNFRLSMAEKSILQMKTQSHLWLSLDKCVL